MIIQFSLGQNLVIVRVNLNIIMIQDHTLLLFYACNRNFLRTNLPDRDRLQNNFP